MEEKAIDYQRDYFTLLFRYHGLLIKRRELKRQMEEAEEFVADSEKEKRIEEANKQLATLKSQIVELQEKIKEVAQEAEQNGCPLELEKICQQYGLSQIEKDVLILLFLYRVPDDSRFDYPTGAKILEYITDTRAEEVLFSSVFFDNSKLLTTKLVRKAYGCEGLNAAFRLSERIMRKIIGNPFSQNEEVKEEEEESEDMESLENLGLPVPQKAEELFEKVTPKVTLADVVLPEEVKNHVIVWLKSVKTSENLSQKWGIKENIVNFSNNIILLYGPPGTGKTMLADAIAYELGVPLMILRFDHLVSCWRGNTEKNIVTMFKTANKKKGVVFIDECDSLLSTRTMFRYPQETWENRIKNLFLQNMELFQGIIILATNFAENLDEAFERRIGMRIAIPMPGIAEREMIWRSFFTNPDILAKNVDFKKLAVSYEFSGGFIKNAVVRAIKMCELNGQKMVTQEILEKAAEEEQESRWSIKSEKRLGFCVRN